MEIKIGNGYRQLQPGETIVADDCVWIGRPETGYWTTTGDAGRKVLVFDLTYRRRAAQTRPAIEPGEGYRLLAVGERIKDGDEIRSSYSGKWSRTVLSGDKVTDGTFRRRVTPPAYPWGVTIVCTSGRSEPCVETNPGPAPEYGWRLLKPSEIIVAGDQSSGWGDPWTECCIAGVAAKYARVERRIDPGEGYRLLAVGERIVEGDDIYWGGKIPQWSPTALVGSDVRDAVFRRKVEVKVDPGAGYRLLKIGETIEKGDESFGRDEIWRPTGDAGLQVEKHSVPRRRKVFPSVEKRYRLLLVGETIIFGDEVLLRGAWKSADSGVCTTYHELHSPIRRVMELGYIGGPA